MAADMRAAVHEMSDCRTIGVNRFGITHAQDWWPPAAPTKDCAGSMARVKAPLLRRRVRGLDPRHALPSISDYRSVGS